jgi:hypothetical protein
VSDAELREFERACAAHPGDAGARCRLARALAAAGRRTEALARLELADLEGEAFREAKALRERLWREGLAGLERRVAFEHPKLAVVGMDLTGTLAGWSCPGEGVGFVDLTTGRTVYADAGCTELDWLDPARGSLFVADARGSVLRVGLSGPESVKLGANTPLAVAPNADRWAVFNAGELRVCRWPSFEAELTFPFGDLHDCLVCWDSGYVVARHIFEGVVRDAHQDVVRSFVGGDDWLVLSTREAFLTELGRGAIGRRTGEGFEVLAIQARRVIPIASCATTAPSLSSDGRGLRFAVAAAKPVRVELDLARGEIRTDRASLHALGGAPPREDHRWHPHADVMSAGHSLVDLEGRVVRSFELDPVAWTEDGTGLLLRGGGHSELWRTRP